LVVTRTSFGALPLQRCDVDDAARILRRAFDAGINFFDTARGYSDSEEKIGRALSDVRDSIIIATKSGATTRSGLLEQLNTSLTNLRTDYVDLLQLHNPGELPDPDDPDSSYAGLLIAKKAGKVRHIGITNHRRDIALAAVESGLFETLQYPMCHLSSPEDVALVDKCNAADMGFIAMKALSGGLITNARAAFAFFRQYQHAVPIWGIQRMPELEEFIALEANPPSLEEMWPVIEQDRRDLAGDFCRGCGYCMPCPQEIPIAMAARMSLLLRRMPHQGFMNDRWHEEMHRIEKCTECGHCREHCPYGLDTPALLRKQLADYEAFYQDHASP
jgi:aryl-alcohol dehydrogenase-like predicted oxidoreductase